MLVEMDNIAVACRSTQVGLCGVFCVVFRPCIYFTILIRSPDVERG